MKLWVLGSGGMVGEGFVQEARQRGIEVVGATHQECDITDLSSLVKEAKNVKPTHIINCAALANVDQAEEEPLTAFAINRDGAANVAKIAKETGSRFVHISTDYVFGGEARSTPYRESDPCFPINIYGKSKWEGEKKVIQEYPDACIVRTSWVFGGKGKNLLSTLLQKFCEKEEVMAVSDQVGNPTYCCDLIDALFSLLNAKGIVHFCNATKGSRYEIALLLWEEAKKHSEKVICKKIIPVASAAFPTKAKRPLYSALDTSHYLELTGRNPRSFLETAKEFISYEKSI